MASPDSDPGVDEELDRRDLTPPDVPKPLLARVSDWALYVLLGASLVIPFIEFSVMNRDDVSCAAQHYDFTASDVFTGVVGGFLFAGIVAYFIRLSHPPRAPKVVHVGFALLVLALVLDFV
jgi:membrane-bound metal-dependent hydrolase YbcI (DUF457 family)